MAERRVADRYVVRSLLGRGGMGAVWRAEDTVLRREVALKQVQPPASVPEDERTAMRSRIMREARAAARLNHPGAATVYDVIEERGQVYIVMELLRAPTLADLVERDGPLPPARAARVGLGVLDVLRAAHRRGIVHRAVKPSNVMVPPDDGGKLADFGIASLQGNPQITSSGLILGSPAYMSPEQARDGACGPAADLWGLGATLYFAVEGRGPFDRGRALPTLTAVLHADPPPPRNAGPLEPVLTSLLEKEPERRPTGIRAERMLRDVAGEGEPRPSQPPAPPASVISPDQPTEPDTHRPLPAVRARRRAHGRRAGALLGAAVLLVLAAVAVTGVGRDEPGRRGAERPQAAPDRPGRPGGTPGTAAVPQGWTRYTDAATGYRIAHPDGWDVERLDDSRTDFRDPVTGTYLRVDWTDSPGDSPVAAWRSQSEAFGAEHADYREIRITPTTYKGFDAALWEYRYSEGGAELRAANLGFTTGDYGFALNFQTRTGRWRASQDLFAAFKDSFQAPG
ncbi:MAG: serine/threonine protein kinase [Actinobacteria bacterium]|nr:serine/threonine protein kinase [Actinomycetota bacterium]